MKRQPLALLAVMLIAHAAGAELRSDWSQAR